VDDTLLIRQQIEETKLQLTDKLESLEQQVSQTVQSAGDAVAATVEAVQGTVESVTGAVEEAVHSVSEAFDLRQQIENHPFLVLGGAVAAGYIAAECMTAYEQAQKNRVHNPLPMGFTPQPIAVNPLWNELKTVAISVLVGTVQGVAMRAVPEIVGAMMNNFDPSAHHPGDRLPRAKPQSPVPYSEQQQASVNETCPNNLIP